MAVFDISIGENGVRTRKVSCFAGSTENWSDFYYHQDSPTHPNSLREYTMYGDHGKSRYSFADFAPLRTVDLDPLSHLSQAAFQAEKDSLSQAGRNGNLTSRRFIAVGMDSLSLAEEALLSRAIQLCETVRTAIRTQFTTGVNFCENYHNAAKEATTMVRSSGRYLYEVSPYSYSVGTLAEDLQ